MTSAFDPVRLGRINAPNRIFMAPLTRARASAHHVPTQIMADYYSQRAGAGLIISEAIGISREGLGWPFAPGIWTREQTDAWKVVVEAVHRSGGRIVAQLWHMGRLVHPSFLKGRAPVSASPTIAPGHAHTYAGKQLYEKARALALAEIPRLIADYRRAADRAMEAGFDGIELHAAYGYLIDQFLRDKTNVRDDAYGGSIGNRIRLLGEVTQALIDVAGADRVGVRLSPNGDSQGVDDSDPETLFCAAARCLDRLGIAFLELREPGPDSTLGPTDAPKLSPLIRQHFNGALILNSDFDLQSANAAIISGLADAVTFGRPFIANPDLVERLRRDLPLERSDEAYWYGPSSRGYADYPAFRSDRD